MLENSQVPPTDVARGRAAGPGVTGPGVTGAGPAGPARQWRWCAALAAARVHWLAAALLTAGLVLRVLVLLAYRPALFYIDTARYLYNDAPGMDPLGYTGP